jgi:hypothetical protein
MAAVNSELAHGSLGNASGNCCYRCFLSHLGASKLGPWTEASLTEE